MCCPISGYKYVFGVPFWTSAHQEWFHGKHLFQLPFFSLRDHQNVILDIYDITQETYDYEQKPMMYPLSVFVVTKS